jgi:hypothetical protein
MVDARVSVCASDLRRRGHAFALPLALLALTSCGTADNDASSADAKHDVATGKPLSPRERATALMRTYLVPEGVNGPVSPIDMHDPAASLPANFGGEVRWASPSAVAPKLDASEVLRSCEQVRADAREKREIIRTQYPAVVAPSKRRLEEARELAEAVRTRGIAAKSVAFAEHKVFSVPDADRRSDWWRDRAAMRQQELDKATAHVDRLKAKYRITEDLDAEKIVFAAEVTDLTREIDGMIEEPCTVDSVLRMRRWLFESGERLTWREHGVRWSAQLTGAAERLDHQNARQP